jgi:hypothetical protein
MAKSKKNTLAQTAELLHAFQTRLDAIAKVAEAATTDVSILLSTNATTVGKTHDAFQSLYKLRDSTQRGFDGVSADLRSVLAGFERLSGRLSKVESQIDERQTSAHFLRMRVDVLEAQEADLKKKVSKLERQGLSVSFQGYEVYFRANRVIFVKDEGVVGFIPLPVGEEIASLEWQPDGLIVNTESGDKYIVCGGPTPDLMFIQFYQKGFASRLAEATTPDTVISATGADYVDTENYD